MDIIKVSDHQVEALDSSLDVFISIFQEPVTLFITKIGLFVDDPEKSNELVFCILDNFFCNKIVPLLTTYEDQEAWPQLVKVVTLMLDKSVEDYSLVQRMFEMYLVTSFLVIDKLGEMVYNEVRMNEANMQFKLNQNISLGE